MCGIGDERPSSTNNGRREHVDGIEAQPSDDQILSIDDYYVDLVENMDQMMKDAEVNNEDEVTDRDYAKFRDLVQDSKKPLYDGSNCNLLDVVLKLLKLKASNCWSDRSFTDLLKLLKEMLPKGNVLPINT